jgi:hypothetical protein
MALAHSYGIAAGTGWTARDGRHGMEWQHGMEWHGKKSFVLLLYCPNYSLVHGLY